MTEVRSYWFSYSKTLGLLNRVDGADTAKVVVIPPGKGLVKLRVKKTDVSATELTLRDVVYIPGCPMNLLFIARLMNLGT
jgi:Pol polyprotein, beta-barrel domain